MVKSKDIALFLQTGTTGTTVLSPVWDRVKYQGELNLAYEAEETEENYIHEGGPTTETERYSVSSDGEYVAYEDDDVFKFLDDIRLNRKTGDAAQTKLLIAYTYKEHSDSTVSTPAYVAEQNTVTVSISQFSGEGGGGKMSISYSLKFNGDPTFGKVTISSGDPTFTADGSGD